MRRSRLSMYRTWRNTSHHHVRSGRRTAATCRCCRLVPPALSSGSDAAAAAPGLQRCHRLLGAVSYNDDVRLRLDRITDRQLLDVRLCDLPLKIEDTHLQLRIEKLYRELNARSLSFRPH